LDLPADDSPAAILHPPKAADNDLDLVTVDVQTRRLLRGALLVSLVLGAGMIWADLVPAFKFLDHWRLWSYTETITPEAAPGQPAPAPTIVLHWITLREVLMALGILVMTTVASRNLPGLLEIAWLRLLPIDSAGRYALVALARYVVIVVGTVSAFNAIGVGWSNVQWLAAAMTVGLGFGLQEIFANFVSGLIILFERPMRVGDTITVSGVSGKVTRIRARATTITDWDNKELIVPNREFITGQLVNWTLSDPVIRLVCNVGVAYNTDPQLTARLLHDVAAAHPLVLTQPAPKAILAEFGASSLDFELCVYISGVDHLLSVRHDLNVQIERVFREAGIEIAFPQCDIHLRDIPSEILSPLVRRNITRAAS
jgi:potassium efflux system protein